MGKNRRSPSRCCDLVIEEMKQLLLFLPVVLGELLSQSSAGFPRSVSCIYGRRAVIDPWSCGCGDWDVVIRPDRKDLAVKTDGNATWIDEEIKLGISEYLHPIEPLDIAGRASGPDWVGGQARWRQGETSQG